MDDDKALEAKVKALEAKVVELETEITELKQYEYDSKGNSKKVTRFMPLI